MANPLDLRAWLAEQCADYTFDVSGVFQRTSEESRWPLHAAGPEELEEKLVQGGHLLPLPKEPAALANVLEVSIVNFLVTRILQVTGAEVRHGTERGYPDLEISGPAFGGGFHAVDVKAARRSRGRGHTQSRITLYTGNTYFKYPDLHWPGTFRPFGSYATHLDVIMIYTFNPGSTARVEDLEIIVQEPWRIASKDRSSTTREYIGAVMRLDDLRAGWGSFPTPDAFYTHWRKHQFKVSPFVHTQLQRAMKAQQEELDELRRRQEHGFEQ